MSNTDKNIEELKNITAYDFFLNTTTDAVNFNTKIVMNYLKVKFGDEGFNKGFMTGKQNRAIAELDKATAKLFEAFKEQYLKNILKTANKKG